MVVKLDIDIKGVVFDHCATIQMEEMCKEVLKKILKQFIISVVSSVSGVWRSHAVQCDVTSSNRCKKDKHEIKLTQNGDG